MTQLQLFWFAVTTSMFVFTAFTYLGRKRTDSLWKCFNEFGGVMGFGIGWVSFWAISGFDFNAAQAVFLESLHVIGITNENGDKFGRIAGPMLAFSLALLASIFIAYLMFRLVAEIYFAFSTKTRSRGEKEKVRAEIIFLQFFMLCISSTPTSISFLAVLEGALAVAVIAVISVWIRIRKFETKVPQQ